MIVTQLQTKVSEDKNQNLDQLEELVEQAVTKGLEGPHGEVLRPDLVTAGEMFLCPYVTSKFGLYAEPEGGASWQRFREIARKHHVYLQPGTMPEIDEAGRLYNTAYMFDRQGNQIAKHRKMHLFDIAVKGGQHYRESDALTAGNEVTVFDTEFGKVGLSVCFDIRFPELFRLMVLQGAKTILVPAAFNMTTGPAHWELALRGRAVDNQCYIVGTSPARDKSAGYTAWGHSLIASPWGEVVSQMTELPDVRTVELDMSQVEKIREQLPLLSARRTDVYRVIGVRQGEKSE